MTGRWLVLVGLIASAAALVGALLILGNTSASPYSFAETLPMMVSDFGANARVVHIDVSDEDIVYEVLGRDGLVHVRDYNLADSLVRHGGRTNTRRIVNSVRPASAADRRDAQVRLGEIPPGVIRRLFARLKFTRFAADATLDGRMWTLSSFTQRFDRYQARYDGTRLHQTQARAGFLSGTGPHSPAQDAGAAARAARNGQRLFTCMRRAHEDITKVLACRRRYAP